MRAIPDRHYDRFFKSPDGTPHGLTVNSFTSVSISPPLILVCIDYGCTLLPYFRLANFFAVNVLSQEQSSLSNTFALKPEGRFDGIDWHPGWTGAPILRGVLAHFECRTSQIAEAGDHAIVIGEVLHAACNSGNPLVFFDRNYRVIQQF